MDDTYPIANRILDARNRLDISQEELADKIGISQQGLSKIESGDSNPSKPVRILLARELNDDLGDVSLKKHLPKKYSAKDLAQILNEMASNPLSPDLAYFVVELVGINKLFKRAIKEADLEYFKSVVLNYEEFMDAFENYGESLREDLISVQQLEFEKKREDLINRLKTTYEAEKNRLKIADVLDLGTHNNPKTQAEADNPRKTQKRKKK